MKNLSASTNKKASTTDAAAIMAANAAASAQHATKLEQLPAVVSALHNAISREASLLEACRAAARAAVVQLDVALSSVDGRVSKVISCYADQLNKSRYVRTQFETFLKLFAAGQQPLSFEIVKTVKGEKVKEEVHTTAEEAAEMPKQFVDQARAELNELLGTGKRKGQRAPQQPSAPEQPKLTEFAMVDKVADLLQDSNWLLELAEVLVKSKGYKPAAKIAEQLADAIETLKP